jgi:large subunit ribosomal protein L25
MSTHHIQLAKSLPPRLIRFFAKYPPPALLPNKPTPTPISTTSPIVTSTTSASDPNAPTLEPLTTLDPSAPPPSSIAQELPYHNPFLPRKNFVTGRWWGPTYGLRKQADLVKLAAKHGVVDLLPHTIKKPGEKEKRRIERGLRVKGTGVGERVKGKKWERTLKGRLEERKQAMLDMPRLIQEWKQVSRDTMVWRGIGANANKFIEGTWTGLEKMAGWKEVGDMVQVGMCCCYYCDCARVWYSSVFLVSRDVGCCAHTYMYEAIRKHITVEFWHWKHYLLCIISKNRNITTQRPQVQMSNSKLIVI